MSSSAHVDKEDAVTDASDLIVPAPEASSEKLQAAGQLVQDGKLAEAIDLYQQIVADDPGNAAAWSDMGAAQRRAGSEF